MDVNNLVPIVSRRHNKIDFYRVLGLIVQINEFRRQFTPLGVLAKRKGNKLVSLAQGQDRNIFDYGIGANPLVRDFPGLRLEFNDLVAVRGLVPHLHIVITIYALAFQNKNI